MRYFYLLNAKCKTDIIYFFNFHSELDVFDTAIQWLLHSWENRKVFTNEVIHSVRFGLLTPLQLTQIAHSPELAKGATFPHEYPELLQYGSVKSMIDDGLA